MTISYLLLSSSTDFIGCLDELIVPDNPKLRVHGKLTLRTSTDINFEGGTIAIQQVAEADLQRAFLNYLIPLDRLFPVYSTLWVPEDGSMPSHPWFISRLHQFFPLGYFLCAGGATSLVASGVLAAQIPILSYWSSDSFRIYIHKNPELLRPLLQCSMVVRFTNASLRFHISCNSLNGPSPPSSSLLTHHFVFIAAVLGVLRYLRNSYYGPSFS
ncbi:hypothetical protein AZE42_08061 [Rhizopogon vesiculosus]|uniref:Uncharacterized protein n=1 Tax=Rhizopogon vesiculosus TaxID=180088 RepID=A0A1J8PIC2_9AGAM|nr:hypothetical protein AZE42_08061 [Rhizopogon vesiculosus]